MALDDTIRQVWARALLQNLQKDQVFALPSIVNRNYEGEIRQWGDRVHIQSIGAVNVIPYTKNTDLGALQVMGDDKQTLTIDQSDAFNVFVDDIDRVQANPGLASELSREASYALSDDADEFLAALMAAGTHADNQLSPTISGADDLYEALVDAGTALDEANIPSAGRFFVLPPWMEGLLLKDARFVSFGTEANRATAATGAIGQAAGFSLFKSNNCPVESDDSTAIGGVPSATTYANQINSVESIRHQARFGDIVRGLHLYGGKVTRPEGLVTITAARPS